MGRPQYPVSYCRGCQASYRLWASCRLRRVGINPCLMGDDDHRSEANPLVVQAWVRGWALARETAPPVSEGDGWRVDVGWPHQQVRYVFSRCSKRLQSLADTIDEPWIFLKACTPPEVMQTLLPPRWIIQPLGFMMIYTGREHNVSLSNIYTLNLIEALAVAVAKVLTANGEIASIGRVVFVDDFAIYDRIETHKDHRRRRTRQCGDEQATKRRSHESKDTRSAGRYRGRPRIV